MYTDFARADVANGIQSNEGKRLTVVSTDRHRFIGCASGLKYHKWFYLTDMWLEQEYRGKGHGKAMLLSLEQIISKNGAENIYLWTQGHEAPGFYERLGYQQFIELEHYHAENISSFGFRKAL